MFLHHLLKRPSLVQCSVMLLCHNSSVHICKDLFLGPLLCHIGLFSIFFPNHILSYLLSVYNKSWYAAAQVFSLHSSGMSQLFLALWISIKFYYQFIMFRQTNRQTKISVRILIVVALNLKISLGNIHISIVLDLLILERGMFLIYVLFCF